MDTWDDNKNIQMLKEELWTRRITAEVTILQRNKVIEETNLLEEIWWNGTKEKEVIQRLKKEDSQLWEDNGIVYVDGWIYIPNNRKIWEQVLQENHDPMNIRYLEQQNYW